MKAAFKTQPGHRVNAKGCRIIQDRGKQKPGRESPVASSSPSLCNLPEWGKVSSEGERKPDCEGQLITYRKPAEM